MFNKTQKFILGLIILILVDVMWMLTHELTKLLHKDEHYEKPFFRTYFKTSMFTMYLIVMGFITPWKEQCDKQNSDYSMMDQTGDDENYYSNQATLSDPTFIPIRTNSGGTPGIVSGAESDDSSVRSVRFCKLAEVREMSAHEATEALMSRLSYTATMRVRRQKNHHETAKIALLFCMLWFSANYLFQLSLDINETVKFALLSSSSSFFTLVLAAVFPSSSGDKLTVTKILAVALNIVGVVNITLGDVQNRKISRGVLLILLSAFFYSGCLVFMKRRGDEEKIDIPLFLGFVGLWNMLLMWPIFLILNCLQIESFELPNQNQFTILVLNGLVGSVLAEALWLWACFLTTSLLGAFAMSLQISLSAVFGVMLKKKHSSPMLYMSFTSILISILLVAVLARYDDTDPLMKLCKIIYRKLCNWRNPSVLRVNDEQQESLIGGSD